MSKVNEFITVLVLFGSVCAMAQTEPHEGKLSADAGIDWRLYIVYFDNMAAYQKNQSAETATDPQSEAYADYWRLRTRPWGRLDFGDDYSLYGRLANEFRVYRNYKQYTPFPNEVFIDNLYVDIRNLWDDRLNLRIGRQDIKYGAGRVIRDGTPGDISRSFYFNAIKAEIEVTEKSTLDLVGMWQQPKDFWTLGDEHTDLTKYHLRDNGNDLTERGLVAYYRNQEQKDFPYELYYVYKDETRWIASNNARLPERRYHTVGMRMIPRFDENWTAEVELAGQYGRISDSDSASDRDILAWMAYGNTTYTAVENNWKPYIQPAVLTFSGDDERFDDPDAQGTDTGWNPVFGRMVIYSDLFSWPFSYYRMSNLVYPHLELGMKPGDGHSFCIQAGPHFACQSNNDNGSTFRGYLAFTRYQFPIVRASDKRRGEVYGVVKAEVLEAGDYYGNPDTAYYLRFQLHAKL